MSSRKLIVSDFDGTISNIQKEAEPYVVAYYDQIALRTGLLPVEIADLMEATKREILEHSEGYGWEYNGLVIAPATADPYVFNRVAAKIVIGKLQKDSRGLILPAETEIDTFLTEIFYLCYPHSGISFRDGAEHYIRRLSSLGQFAIVTNGDTAVVKRKVETLLGENNIVILGNAQKHLVDLTWQQVPMSVQPEGFPRPVLLQRKKYHEVLTSLGRPISVVIGDEYEMDLALPEAEGMHTILIRSPLTPAWEWNYYSNSHRLRFTTLEEATNKVVTDHSF